MELLEEILSKENMNEAYKSVCRNKGIAGVDGVTVEELKEYLKQHKERILREIRARKYKPQPVLQIKIPKENGKKRKLGIPTVVDRVIQQSILQILSPIYEKQFSESSYGFRPGRSCEKAVIKSLELMNDGYDWIVDIDPEKLRMKLKRLSKRNWSISLSERIKCLNDVIRGWVNYFKICDMKKAMEKLDEKLRSRVRVVIWKQWKNSEKRISSLQRVGIGKEEAKGLTYCRKGYRFIGNSCVVHRALSNKRLKERGLVFLLDHYLKVHTEI